MDVFGVGINGCSGCSGCTITISKSALKVDLGRVLLYQGNKPASVLCQDFWSDALPVELSCPNLVRAVLSSQVFFREIVNHVYFTGFLPRDCELCFLYRCCSQRL